MANKKGYKHTQETKDKMSKKTKGLIPPNKGKRSGKFVKCDMCGNDVYILPSNKFKHHFCCRKCSSEYNKGENVYNYKGGYNLSSKHKWIRENSSKYKQWRKYILDRDKHKCKICGSSEQLEVHHIIPFTQCPELVVLKMNGICLCHKCHKETDSYGVNYKNVNDDIQATYYTFTIPHKYQVYETVGNYEQTENGTWVIFVSDLDSEDMELCVLIHEMIEIRLCEKANIKEEDITAFDIQFEKERELGLYSLTDEPGDFGPYIRQHQIATKIEKQVAKVLGVNWKEYENKINLL